MQRDVRWAQSGGPGVSMCRSAVQQDRGISAPVTNDATYVQSVQPVDAEGIKVLLQRFENKVLV